MTRLPQSADGAKDEDSAWQRLDKWLWCARFLKARAACGHLVVAGAVRINRQPTDKPHARLHPGDVLTLQLRGEVRVIRVLALAARRGPPAEARLIYEEIPAPDAPQPPGPVSCAAGETPAYRPT